MNRAERLASGLPKKRDKVKKNVRYSAHFHKEGSVKLTEMQLFEDRKQGTRSSKDSNAA